MADTPPCSAYAAFELIENKLTDAAIELFDPGISPPGCKIQETFAEVHDAFSDEQDGDPDA